MIHKTIFCVVICFLVYGSRLYSDPSYDIKTTTTSSAHHHHHHQSSHTDSNHSDKEITEHVIAVLTSMANSILNISSAAHNPQVIGANVVNIVSSLVNFLTFALKNPGVVDLLQDELFQDALRSYILRKLKEGKLEELAFT